MFLVGMEFKVMSLLIGNNASSYRGVGNPRVDQLIHVESDESMDDDGEDDDVFGEDQEVCDVMRGVAGRSSPPRAPSPLPHHHHPHHHQSQVSSGHPNDIPTQTVLD